LIGRWWCSWLPRFGRVRRLPACRYEPIEAFGTSCLLIVAPGGAHAAGVDWPC
jgi:hypothetical protein